MGIGQSNQKSVRSSDACFGLALLPSGWARNVRISMAGGIITDVEADVATLTSADHHKIALPGMANLHSHAFQRGMSGLTEFRSSTEDSFWSWRDLLYKFVRSGDPADIEAISAMAFCEMLEGGFTRVAEFHYLHHGADCAPFSDPAEMSARIVAAARTSGIGLTLLPVFYAHSDFGGAAPLNGQRRFTNTVDGFCALAASAADHCRTLPDAVVGFAPHSLRATTPEQLTELCRRLPGGPVHIHVAEQVKEVEASIAWSGARPVEWLLANVDVNERWCLIHATHTTPAERRAIAASGAVVGLCPVTEANLGDGIFELSDFINAGGRFGVGSDSNVSISAADELRMLEYSQRLNVRRRNVLTSPHSHSTGRALFERASRGGDQAVGVESGLRPGLSADFIVLDHFRDIDCAADPDRILDHWVFGQARSKVSEVWRRGMRVVQDGRHIHRETIEARFTRAMERFV